MISSARRTFVNTGPRRRTNSLVFRSKTYVPVMSAGRRSGVNCTRLKSHPRAAAKDFAIRVFARPG